MTGNQNATRPNYLFIALMSGDDDALAELEKLAKMRKAVEEINRLLGVYGNLWGGKEGVDMWLVSPEKELNNRTPQSVIDEGRPEEVLDLLNDLLFQ